MSNALNFSTSSIFIGPRVAASWIVPAAVFLAVLLGGTWSTPVLGQDPAYVMSVRGGVSGTGGCQEVEILLDHTVGAPAEGWQLSVCHDPGQLRFLHLDQGAAVSSLLQGQPPFFFGMTEHPDGWLSGLLLDAFSPLGIPPGVDVQLQVATYEVLAPAGTTAPVSFCMLGLVDEGVAVAGAMIRPTTVDGQVDVQGAPVPCETYFVRGDANDDGGVNIADPIFVLATLFTGGPDAVCRKAADANDDGSINIADPVLALAFLFQAGPDPVAPFPSCGPDPTPDAQPCDVSHCP